MWWRRVGRLPRVLRGYLSVEVLRVSSSFEVAVGVCLQVDPRPQCLRVRFRICDIGYFAMILVAFLGIGPPFCGVWLISSVCLALGGRLYHLLWHWGVSVESFGVMHLRGSLGFPSCSSSTGNVAICGASSARERSGDEVGWPRHVLSCLGINLSVCVHVS